MPDDSTTARERTALPRWVYGTAAAALLAGVIAFAAAAAQDDSARAWRALLVNFLFWVGMGQAGIVWAAIFRATAARWTAAVGRLGQATIAFLPFSLLLLVALWVGRPHFLLWLGEDLGERAVWLNPRSLLARDLGGLALLCVLSLLYVRLNLRADALAAKGGEEAAIQPMQRCLTNVSVAIVIAYAFIYTVIAFDLIMSLDGHWYSTLFGGHFFISNLYVGMAALILAAIALRGRLEVGEHLGSSQLADMGNLMMAFGMLTVSFFFCQLLTIWYGNLPEETGYLATRLHSPAWLPYGYVVLVLGYLGPFFLLLLREVKHNRRILATVSVVVILGMWLERYLLVVPTLQPEGASPGLVDVLVGLGLAGALVGSAGLFLSRYPALSHADLARTGEQHS
ncbi:MAG: NrfD/PsrC family molybdoenzyme membrane anchor subunit [Armatimonadota bacterium]